jgi:hypothetical protein
VFIALLAGATMTALAMRALEAGAVALSALCALAGAVAAAILGWELNRCIESDRRAHPWSPQRSGACAVPRDLVGTCSARCATTRRARLHVAIGKGESR